MNENNKIFGTDGIRGKVGEYPMTVDFTMRLASAIASTLTPNGGQVAIGKDTRISGYMFESALESAFVAYGLKVILLGPLPSPAISHYVRESEANFGVVISASHNSYEYNGIKIINQNGEKIEQLLENTIESRLDDNPVTKTANMIGKAYRSGDSRDKYKELLRNVFNGDTQPLNGLKIVVDTSNGAAYKIAPQVLLELGAEVIPIACSPNGYNINKNCGSTYPDTIKNTVQATNADLGIALDGDADRILLVDEQGQLLDGDKILYILTTVNIDNSSFNSKVVGTVMSNSGLEKSLKKKNIELLRSDVGDKNVYKMMQSSGSIIGGETSGHIINLEYLPTGDGLLTALIIIKESLDKKNPISELTKELTLVNQHNINIDLQNVDTEKIDTLQDKASTLIEDGRVIIRKSGTEPLLRILIESDNEETVNQVKNLIKEINK
ncbi:MAG: phosphoglucosamine mutase [Gammaproteobacteria bacterium]|nr:phosphoglucosamine mutase [Gammaproteobacteria bacterium]